MMRTTLASPARLHPGVVERRGWVRLARLGDLRRPAGYLLAPAVLAACAGAAALVEAAARAVTR